VSQSWNAYRMASARVGWGSGCCEIHRSRAATISVEACVISRLPGTFVCRLSGKRVKIVHLRYWGNVLWRSDALYKRE
jgi:hypothetical protein